MLGLKIIVENPELRTMFRMFVYDSDAVSAYPSAAMVANVAKSTTLCEIIDILGVEEMTFRFQNINFMQGHVNALEYCERMFSLPTPQQSLGYFQDMV